MQVEEAAYCSRLRYQMIPHSGIGALSEYQRLIEGPLCASSGPSARVACGSFEGQIDRLSWQEKAGNGAYLMSDEHLYEHQTATRGRSKASTPRARYRPLPWDGSSRSLARRVINAAYEGRPDLSQDRQLAPSATAPRPHEAGKALSVILESRSMTPSISRSG
jgi:hypothetical protein